MLDIMILLNVQRIMFSTGERTRCVFAAASILDKAGKNRITSKTGTNVTMEKKGRPGNAQVGFADISGYGDNFGWGDVNCAPLEYSANGTLTVEPGDALPSVTTSSEYSYLLEPPLANFGGKALDRFGEKDIHEVIQICNSLEKEFY